MSCPNWRALLRERDEALADPASWAESVEHLDGCPACRAEALRLDPTLIFRRLPAAVVTAGEVADMKQGVAAMIRASRVQGVTRPLAESAGAALPRRRAARWAWPAAAAAIASLGLVLSPGIARPPARPALLAAGRPPVLGSGAAVIEDLNLPQARVYEFAADEMQVVMIVDPSFNL